MARPKLKTRIKTKRPPQQYHNKLIRAQTKKLEKLRPKR